MEPPKILLLALALVTAALPVSGFHPGAQEDASRDVTFDPGNLNEWWVEVYLGGSEAHDVVEVEARDTNGAWETLTKRSWGAWAASFHVEEGHEVRFAALLDTGVYVQSCWFTHPEGFEQCDDAGSGGDAPTGDLTATFDTPGGNEWWVEVDVDASETLTGVSARVDSGTWHSLTKKSWGAWAASFHVPDGSHVQFRATSTDGDRVLSGNYMWPTGEPAGEGGGGGTGSGSDPGTDNLSASFSTPGGNEWWVEVYVDAAAPLAGVEARADGGIWHPLKKRSWGAWAASFHVPDGSHVQFRATSPEGASALSGEYRWPDGTLVEEAASDPDAWPREGSHVLYELHSGGGAPDGSYRESTDVNVTLEYVNGEWQATCEGWSRTWRYDYDTDEQRLASEDRIQETAALAPARAPMHVQVGDLVRAEVLLTGCTRGTLESTPEVAERTTREAERNGQPVTAPVWIADWEPVSPEYVTVTWHTGTGLVLDWRDQEHYSAEYGRLVDTDAPLHQEDAETRARDPAGWPDPGSYVNYATDRARLDLTFQDGYWQGLCVKDDGTEVHVPFDPLRNPTDVQEGDRVESTLWNDCNDWPQEVIAQGVFKEDTTRNGEPHTAMAWWADETAQEEADGIDRDAWWDTDTGLVLRWENLHTYPHTKGRVTDTDAPLSQA